MLKQLKKWPVTCCTVYHRNLSKYHCAPQRYVAAELYKYKAGQLYYRPTGPGVHDYVCHVGYA